MDAIHLPPGLTLPSAFGAPAAPLQAGQVIQALVLELIQSDIFRLQLPQATVDVRSSVPLTPGSTITLAVKGGGPGARLAIYPDVPAASSGSPARGAALPPPNLTRGTPIGEAVVISRAPAGQGAVTSQGAPVQLTNAAPAPSRTAVAPEVPARRLPAGRVPEPPARPVTPEQAITDAIRTAAPRQTGLAPLFADLERIAPAPGATPAPAPLSIAKAAESVLSLRVRLDETVTGAHVKQAFARSGVLLEAKLAVSTALSPGDVPRSAGPPIAPTSRDDLKAALLVLRQVLAAWHPEPAVSHSAAASVRPAVVPSKAAHAQLSAAAIGQPVLRDLAAVRHIASALAGAPQEFVPTSALPPNSLSPDEATGLAKTLASALVVRDTTAPQPPSGAAPVAPPYRGAPLAAQTVAAPSIAPDAAPHEVAEKLLAATDGALARQTLLQAASLPEQPGQPRTEAAQRWNFEIPFATPQGTAIAQFEVSRDAHAQQADPQARTWRARFSLDVEPMGPVHAMVALAGARTSVTLWAERAATATRLNEHAPRLSEALRAAELEPADFQFRVGAPPAMAKRAAPGRFMDRAS